MLTIRRNIQTIVFSFTCVHIVVRATCLTHHTMSITKTTTCGKRTSSGKLIGDLIITIQIQPN